MNGNNPRQRKTWHKYDDSGFFFDELNDFQTELMLLARKGFPDESKKFLKQEGHNLIKLQKQIAKGLVGTSKGKKKDWDKKKSYMAKFKSSKVFKHNGETCVSAYNSARHSHLIEYGHKTQNGNFVPGKYVIEKSKNQFVPTFLKDCDEFLDTVFNAAGWSD